MAAKPEDARRVIAAAADVLAVARQCGLAVIHLKLSLSAHPRARQQGMTQPFWRAMHELAETDRLTPGRPSTVDGDNIQRFTRHRNHAYAQGDYVIDNKKRLDCFFGTDLHQLPQALATHDVVPDGHHYQYLCAQGGLYRLQISIIAWSFCRTASPACTGKTCTSSPSRT